MNSNKNILFSILIVNLFIIVLSALGFYGYNNKISELQNKIITLEQNQTDTTETKDVILDLADSTNERFDLSIEAFELVGGKIKENTDLIYDVIELMDSNTEIYNRKFKVMGY